MIDPKTFEDWWARPVEWVDAPNRRGRGTSYTGIANASEWPELSVPGRIYVKRQIAYHCRPVWNAGRRTPTLRREYRHLTFCRERGIPVPRVLAYAEGEAQRAMLVLQEILSVEDFETAMLANSDTRSYILENTIRVFKRLHRARIRHGALHPKHVLISAPPDYDVWLIDFEKARVLPSRAIAARSDLAQFLRHAQFLRQHERDRIRQCYVEAGILPPRAI